MQKMIIVGTLAASLASTNVARADFSRAGTKAIEGDLDLGIGRSTKRSPSGTEESTTVAAVNLGAAYFVADNVSLGGRVLLGYQADDERSQTVTGVMLTAGFTRALSERLYIWPRAGLALSRASISFGDESASIIMVGLQLQAPVYVQPAEHLLIGLGPALSADLGGRIYTEDGDQEVSKTTDIGLAASLVGWW